MQKGKSKKNPQQVRSSSPVRRSVRGSSPVRRSVRRSSPVRRSVRRSSPSKRRRRTQIRRISRKRPSLSQDAIKKLQNALDGLTLSQKSSSTVFPPLFGEHILRIGLSTDLGGPGEIDPLYKPIWSTYLPKPMKTAVKILAGQYPNAFVVCPVQKNKYGEDVQIGMSGTYNLMDGTASKWDYSNAKETLRREIGEELCMVPRNLPPENVVTAGFGKQQWVVGIYSSSNAPLIKTPITTAPLKANDHRFKKIGAFVYGLDYQKLCLKVAEAVMLLEQSANEDNIQALAIVPISLIIAHLNKSQGHK